MNTAFKVLLVLLGSLTLQAEPGWSAGGATEAGVQVGGGDSPSGSTFDSTLFATTDLRFGDRWGAQTDGEFVNVQADEGDRATGAVNLHGYYRLRETLAFGLMVRMGREDGDTAQSVAVEFARAPQVGFGFEAYFGETRLDADRHRTNKGLEFSYAWKNTARLALVGHKDTTNYAGQTDEDFYIYGLALDVPLTRDRRTRLLASAGQHRYDSRGGVYGHIGLGVSYRFGGSADRPTFGHTRTTLARLALD